MKNFNQALDFLELQQQEDKLNTNQLHLIIQTLATFLDDEQLISKNSFSDKVERKEVEVLRFTD